MIEKYTSIIVTSYDLTQVLRNITLACLLNVVKHTDPSTYEIIFMDTIPEGCEVLRWFDDRNILQFGEREDRRWIKQYLSEMENPGQYGSMNRGAQLARGEYLCFLQNDVLVPDKWLENMRYYIENDLGDIIFPDQNSRSYEEMQEIKNMSFEDDRVRLGKREAGLMLVRKKLFDEIGGWNEKIRVFFGEKDFYKRVSVQRERLTNKVNITHIDSATYWTRQQLESEKLKEDITISNEVSNAP